MSSFLASDEWRTAIGDPQWARPAKTIGKAAVDDLLGILAGSGAERLAAFQMLRAINRKPADYPLSEWDAAAASQFGFALRSWAEGYFTGNDSVGDDAFGSVQYAWLEFCLEEGVSFLASREIRALDSHTAQALVEALAQAARRDSRAVNRLNGIVAEGGELGVAAQRGLETAGFVSQERVEHFGRLWRQERSVEALAWLYTHWIESLPVGFPKVEILRVLGPPTDGTFPDVYWSLSDGNHVYLEIFESGLSGCHRT